MFKSSSIFAIFLILCIILGCSSARKSGENPTNYNRNLGTAYPTDVKEKTARIFNKYNYVIIRHEESFEQIYFETDWRYRGPFDDEIDLGIVDARTRLIVNATPRTRSGTDLYTVRMTAETQVRFEDTNEYITVPMTDMLMAYLKTISDDLRLELMQGIRRY